MKRLLTVIAITALLVALAAPVAVAVNKVCSVNPCYGTSGKDTLFERGGNDINDRIYGKNSNDKIFADRFGDDRDKLYGGHRNDTLNALDGDDEDLLNGGTGSDTCTADPGDVVRSCNEVKK